MKLFLQSPLSLITTFVFIAFSSFSQETPDRVKVAVNPFDGIMVMGYVDNGAFLNFTGPNLSFSKGKSKLMFGMLPSLRYKEDHSTIKNAPLTPNLGMGMTFCYKKIVLQVPLYYNAKTATANGEWNVGVGIGFRLK